MKIVINDCHGGFALSYKAVMRYAALKGFRLYPWIDHIYRDVYNDQAIIGNDAMLHHYSRVPVEDLPHNKHGDPLCPSDAYFSEYDIERTDPTLIQVIEELGAKANGQCASLKIVDIPDDAQYTIEEYDGREHIAERHRTWR